MHRVYPAGSLTLAELGLGCIWYSAAPSRSLVYIEGRPYRSRGGCRTFEREGSNLLGLHAKEGGGFGLSVKKAYIVGQKRGGGGPTPRTPPPPFLDPLLTDLNRT